MSSGASQTGSWRSRPSSASRIAWHESRAPRTERRRRRRFPRVEHRTPERADRAVCRARCGPGERVTPPQPNHRRQARAARAWRLVVVVSPTERNPSGPAEAPLGDRRARGPHRSSRRTSSPACRSASSMSRAPPGRARPRAAAPGEIDVLALVAGGCGSTALRGGVRHARRREPRAGTGAASPATPPCCRSEARPPREG